MQPQLYHLRLTKVTSLLVIAHQSSLVHTGTPEQLAAVYQKVLMRNLALGWWSVPGLVWTSMALVRNRKAMQRLQQLVATQQ